MKYTTLLWGAHTFLRKTRCTHHNINVSTIGNLQLKSGYSPETSKAGCIFISHVGTRDISCKQLDCTCIVVGIHTKGMKHTNIVRCIHFSQLNNMYTWQHQYIHYRKPSLKIRPNSPEAPPECINNTTHVAIQPSGKWEDSWLVLTTTATDLDSTDRADVRGELKIAQPVSC